MKKEKKLIIVFCFFVNNEKLIKTSKKYTSFYKLNVGGCGDGGWGDDA